MTTIEKRLTAKELASELGRSRYYVYWMKLKGFAMPGGKATISEANRWLLKHPLPCKRAVKA